MHRALILLVAAACGTTTDTRPETAAYITEAILVPNCGTASCHASGTAAHGYVFDTVANANESLAAIVTPGNPARSELVDLLNGTGPKVMPPDQPLPTVDIELITHWIDDGADGL